MGSSIGGGNMGSSIGGSNKLASSTSVSNLGQSRFGNKKDDMNSSIRNTTTTPRGGNLQNNLKSSGNEGRSTLAMK